MIINEEISYKEKSKAFLFVNGSILRRRNDEESDPVKKLET
ncbi:MAG: hypothetical protein ABSB40_02735 [Nitrososphaeria archaeon]